ncbi:hypothetical protein BEP19_16905 [Ammoniphilus oxalaticus]|uniref:Cyclic GMP-AMP synthase n=1 Tax=Ammoniphilus oxalaticus TaxID=66863 RepID=A0A419SQ67_9BACL|nr:hypothetical protein BEP19_16905 [Ammoniphilus oxalaticus]
MAHCQKQFTEFHDAIKLTEENQILAEKRDIIINRIKDKIPDEAKDYTTFNQGSYAMHTGIKPLDENYDIDLGLYFKMSKEDVKPVEAKQWILDAVTGHTNDVKMKTPCITVSYQAGYHVDITVYASENSDGKVYLAKGRPGSAEENKKWDESNPKDLIKTIRDHFDNENDRKQFRRIIRYLKRWKDIQFKNTTYGKPTGIALTACAYHHMYVKKEIVDIMQSKVEYRDLDALTTLVSNILDQFRTVSVIEDDSVVYYPKITVDLPVAPYPDLFEKMSLKQMKTFKKELESLLECLLDAKAEADPTDAAEILKKAFGDDFPVPPRKDTGKKAAALALIPSSESA